MQTLSIIIPVYNEEKLIGQVMDEVLHANSLGLKKEIIIVDDGSTDGTAEKINSFITSFRRKSESRKGNYIDPDFHRDDNISIYTIFKKKNEGKGSALKAGFAKATGDILMVQDADCEYDTADYADLIKPFLQHSTSVVYGSRNQNRKKFNTKYSYLPFYWGGIILTWFINLLFGSKLTDQATGYKLFSKKLKNMLLSPNENTFSYEVAVTGLLANAGHTIQEVPIHYSPRSFEEGKKIGTGDFIESVFVAIKYFFLRWKVGLWEKVLFFIPIGLILFFCSDVLFHLSSRIHDWMDGTFMIWTIQNNINHFTSLAVSKIYETNAMYPFPYSLSMTDHFYFPSLIATVISFFSSNFFLQFNFLSISNHILLYLSFFLLAGRFTKSIGGRIVAAFYFSFGPYFFLQTGHLQMVFLWPFVLSLYHLFDGRKSTTSYVFSGIWMGLQFLTGTYLGVMGLVMIGLYYAVLFFTEHDRTETLKKCVIFFVSFLLVAGVSIYGYLLVNAMYHPIRDQGQYVSYAAHITDYLFPINKSFIYSFFSSWSSLNKHVSSERGAFIGLLPLVVGSYWLVVSRKIDTRYRKIAVWLTSVMMIGFIFSLGPRFNWNGEYKVFPLPYLALLKVFPPLGIIRATARWYVLIHMAVSISLVLFLSRIESVFPKEKRKLIMVIFFMFALLEFYPPPMQTVARDYKRPSDLFLKELCKRNNGPILEYPFEYRADDKTVGKTLATKTNTLMYSTLHTCPTLSGFSSYEPPLFQKWQKDFDINGITDINMKMLRDNKFMYIRVNVKALTNKEQKNPSIYIHTRDLEELYRDSETVIYKII